jgi:hypothetical protein
VQSGGVVSPGLTLGASTLSVGNTTFGTGGILDFNLRDATATAGTGWDLLQVNGALSITATDVSPFQVQVTSLAVGDVAGNASNFTTGDTFYWTLMNATGGITGFNPDAFQIDLTGFSNAHDGLWFVTQAGDSLQLAYAGFTPVPEPAEWAGLCGLGLLFWAIRRRIR